MTAVDKFKLSSITWDGDKEPRQFHLWLEQMSSIVRATEHGPPLEEMLDSKLGRAKVSSGMVASYLLSDPDFAPSKLINGPLPVNRSALSAELGRLFLLADVAARKALDGADGADAAELQAAATAAATARDEAKAALLALDSADAASSSSGVFSLGAHGTKYDDLTAESKALDSLLYNVLRCNVKGSKNSLLACVTFPSYVQGIVVLSKHMELSRMERIMTAFGEMDKLAYSGNVHQFQSTFMSLSRELSNTKATMQHYVFCRLMRSFDGRNKTVQYKIAEDFNKLNFDEPEGSVGGIRN